jgi:CelD/BcsL family acetyltransferase involved in cellulose biosynthesis
MHKLDLDCTVLRNVEQLESLSPAWSALVARSSSNEPVLTPTWLLAWWKVFGSVGGRELRVAVFHEGNRLIGLAPFLRRRHWYRPGLPFRRLEMLGSGEHDSEQIYSEYLNLICECGAEAQVAGAFANSVVAGRFGKWDELVIPRMDGQNVLPGLLVESFNQAGISAGLTVTESAPYVPLPVSWDTYLKALTSSNRYFIKRSLRDFDKWAGGQAKFHCATSREELEKGKQILVSLHGQRWSADGHPGIFSARRFQAFHETVMPALFDQGALELIWLTVRGEPVAAIYNIVWDGKVYFYQSGRKTDVPKNVRLGVVMQTHAIKTALAAGRREYDFLGGAAQYKLQMALASRPLVEFRASCRPLLEGMRCLANYGVARIRSLRGSARYGGFSPGGTVLPGVGQTSAHVSAADD